MSGIGLAVITSTLTPCLSRRLRPCIKSIADECSSLYLHFAPLLPPLPPPPSSSPVWTELRPQTYANDELTRDILFGIYGNSDKDAPQLDLRIVISNFTRRPSTWHPPQHRVHGGRLTRLYTDASSSVDRQRVVSYVQAYFSLFHSASNEITPTVLHLAPPQPAGGTEESQATTTTTKTTVPEESEDRRDDGARDYDHVVLGGTFDRLHTGHKILLTASALVAEKSATVGVTDGAMNRKKTLSELIEPIHLRLDAVRNFLEDVKPSVDAVVVPITDPFGPSIVDPRLQAIVVSEETVSGGEAVNKRREANGLSTLEVVTIPLLEDDDDGGDGRKTRQAVTKEDKISSSGKRFDALGTLLRPPKVPRMRREKEALSSTAAASPFVIGLTGGIASGKTSIAKRLEKLGASRIDCDALGHRAYEKGTACYSALVAAFGSDILCPDSMEIDRKRLGPIVFADPEKLTRLNGIVWPAIQRLALAEIDEAGRRRSEVVVMEAAVLLEASWDEVVDEVWVCIVPPSEAIKRVVDRNGISVDEAQKRLDAQLSNGERVAAANVVLSSLWEPEVTQKQCEKAWRLLKERMSR